MGLWIQLGVIHDDVWRFYLRLSNVPAMCLPKTCVYVGHIDTLTPETLTPGGYPPERLASLTGRVSQVLLESPQPLSSPHHTHWINVSQLARAAAPSNSYDHDPGPDTPFRFNQRTAAVVPQISRIWGNYGEISRDLGYNPLLYSAKCADGILWRADMRLSGLLACSVEVWTPCRSLKLCWLRRSPVLLITIL